MDQQEESASAIEFDFCHRIILRAAKNFTVAFKCTAKNEKYVIMNLKFKKTLASFKNLDTFATLLKEAISLSKQQKSSGCSAVR